MKKPSLLKIIFNLVSKDIILELKSKETFYGLFLFSVLVFLLFNFSFGNKKDVITQAIPGILWIAFLFSGTLGVGKTFYVEKEEENIFWLMLLPIDRSNIFLAKFFSNYIFLIVNEIIILPVFAVLFNQSILSYLMPLILVILMGSIGFTALSTLLSFLSASSKSKEIMLPLLLYPLLVPLAIACLNATDLIVNKEPLSEYMQFLKLIFAFDLIFFVAAYFAFPFLLEE